MILNGEIYDFMGKLHLYLVGVLVITLVDVHRMVILLVDVRILTKQTNCIVSVSEYR